MVSPKRKLDIDLFGTTWIVNLDSEQGVKQLTGLCFLAYANEQHQLPIQLL